MDHTLPIVQTLSLANLIQLLIITANRIQLLSGPPCSTYAPPPRTRPLREPAQCGCQCMICGAPCATQKAGHTHHRCYQHRHQWCQTGKSFQNLAPRLSNRRDLSLCRRLQIQIVCNSLSWNMEVCHSQGSGPLPKVYNFHMEQMWPWQNNRLALAAHRPRIWCGLRSRKDSGCLHLLRSRRVQQMMLWRLLNNPVNACWCRNYGMNWFLFSCHTLDSCTTSRTRSIELIMWLAFWTTLQPPLYPSTSRPSPISWRRATVCTWALFLWQLFRWPMVSLQFDWHDLQMAFWWTVPPSSKPCVGVSNNLVPIAFSVPLMDWSPNSCPIKSPGILGRAFHCHCTVFCIGNERYWCRPRIHCWSSSWARSSFKLGRVYAGQTCNGSAPSTWFLILKRFGALRGGPKPPRKARLLAAHFLASCLMEPITGFWCTFGRWTRSTVNMVTPI